MRRGTTWRRTAGRLVLFVALGSLAACARNAPMDTLQPAGPNARTINDLNAPVFLVAAVIFVLVEGAVIFFVMRYRQRPGREDPVQIHGNTRVEIAWTLIPALILAVLAVPTVFTIFKLARTPPRAINVTVTGHQFWWEYRYEDLGIVTANELHMPVGTPVELELRGADVIHSFWVPRLGGKTDVVPGRRNHMNLKADRPGRYLGQCTEFCGLSHANMRLVAVAQTQSDFDAWVAAQRRAPATPPPGTPAADGLTTYNQRGCGGCHTIEGVSQGRTGPNLTHFHSRRTFAGSTFAMTPDNLRTWLRDPPGAKPGSKMPNLQLPAADITKLIAYLETLN